MAAGASPERPGRWHLDGSATHAVEHEAWRQVQVLHRAAPEQDTVVDAGTV